MPAGPANSALITPTSLRVGALALLSGAFVALLGGGQTYWVCLPAALLASALAGTRLGASLAAAAVVAAAAVPAALADGVERLPPAWLAVLVPAASAAVLVTMRERLEAEREAMRRSALSDPLTGVANRRSLLSRIEYEIARHERTRHSFSVLMLDLDGFKQLNDRFGHAAGDDLLRDVARAIAGAIRDQDTVARMGGDEFCVLAPETDVRGTQRLAGRVLAAVGTVTTGIEVLGASAGVSAFPADGRTAARLLDAADQRLLDVKRERHAARRVRRAA